MFTETNAINNKLFFVYKQDRSNTTCQYEIIRILKFLCSLFP